MTKQFMQKVVEYGWLVTKKYHYVAVLESRYNSMYCRKMPCVVIYRHDKIAMPNKPHLFISSKYRLPVAIYSTGNGWMSWTDYVKTREVKE